MKKKKIIISMLILLLLTGCQETKKEVEKEEETKVIKKEHIITNNLKEIKKNVEEKIANLYIDHNNMPIGIYDLKGRTLTKVSKIYTKLDTEKVIDSFQIYPSDKETVNLNGKFGESFYNEYIKYNKAKIGFNIKFSLKNGKNISYNILDPSHTFDHQEYFMNYLYDDYANRYKNFYSHLEPKDYSENTLFTTFKMQCGWYMHDINSNILLTVFTYDSEDDFKNNEYRGKSYHTITICVEGFAC